MHLFTLSLLLQVWRSIGAADKADRKTSGRPCNPDDEPYYEVWSGDQKVVEKYLYCDKEARVLVVATCPETNGAQRLFDQFSQRCLPPSTRNKRQTFSSGFVGSFCSQNIDCIDARTMYCVNGQCTCLSDYTPINSYCEAKVSPGQSGCNGRNEQCLAVWYGTACVNNVCVCPGDTGNPNSATNPVTNPTRLQVTRDGYICVAANSCPLPIDYGVLSILTTGTTQQTCDPTVNMVCTSNPAITTESLIDTYDCIPTIATPVAAANNGLCCPNRAFTCIMPVYPSTPGDVGTEVGSSIHWYYNAIAGGCQQFRWTPYLSGQIGNANNFPSKEQCESYCLQSCPRGQFQYTTTAAVTSTTLTTPIRQQCASATCTSDYTCTTIGSSQYCCMRQANICANRGGLTSPSTGTTVIQGVQSTVPNTITGAAAGSSIFPPITRYRYNSTSRSCVSFTWFQQAGDYNNFASQADCESFCGSVLCTQGDPIKDSNGNNLACSSNAGCPASHTCTNSVCCPTRQTVCTAEKRPGSCNTASNRYWYNSVTKECELFSYSGCNGNANNFATLLACQAYCRNTEPKPNCIQGEPYRNPYSNAYITSCSTTGVQGTTICPTNYECYFDGFLYGCCPIQTFVCGQSSSDRGNICGPQITRWFYDTTTRLCSTFTYNGCGGNPNNFVNRESCETYCGVGGCPYGGQPFRETNQAYRICSTQNTCPSGYDCIQVTVASITASRCCPNRAFICTSAFSSGTTCGDSIQRWYFNSAARTCQQFTFNGCDSNGNNFATKAQCDDFCESAACGLGEIAYANPSTGNVQTCNPNIQSACLSGFTCSFDTSLTRNYVCCGSTDAGVCPVGEKAFIDPLTFNPRTCQPGSSGTGGCPGSYLCRLSRNVLGTGSTLGYYCCSNAQGTRCPIGKLLYQTQNNLPVLCTANTVLNPCPNGFSCQSAVASTTGVEGYCCSVQPVCPNGVNFQMDSSEIPTVCSIGSTFQGCTGGFVCSPSPLSNSSLSLGFCCNSTGLGSSTVCGLDRTPFLVTNNPQSCNIADLNPCSVGYSCLQSLVSRGSYYCCSPSVTEVCATGLTAERQPGGNGPRPCSPNVANACSAGYSCVAFGTTPATTSFWCCSGGAATETCPSGLIGYRPLGSTVTQPCSGPGSPCQTGYTCQFSRIANTWQCCGQQAGCPAGSVTDADPTTGQPDTCTTPGSTLGCNAGFICTSTATTGLICCTPSLSQPVQTLPDVQCSQGMMPITDGNGNVQVCGSCPTGFACQTTTSSPVCCPTTTDAACNQPLQVGSVCSTKPTSSRFFFNTNSRACESFTYNGCGGNSNNFFSQAACVSFCGTQPTVPPVVQQLCPIAGQSAYNFPGTTQVVTCSPTAAIGGAGACPAGFTCQNSPQLGFLICCGTAVATTLFCPISGQQPYRGAPGNQIQTCSSSPLGVQSTCPAGYTCQQALNSNVLICCGSATFVNPQTCPTGSNVYINPSSSTPLVCTFNVNICPPNYRCLYSNSLREYYCCSGSDPGTGLPAPVVPVTGSNGCPFGRAYLYQNTGVPLACPPNSSSCPPGYQCVFSTLSNAWQCCTNFRKEQPDNSNSTEATPQMRALDAAVENEIGEDAFKKTLQQTDEFKD